MANIRNSHTRKAHARAAAEFAAWCEERGITALAQVQPVHVTAWVEEVHHQRHVDHAGRGCRRD